MLYHLKFKISTNQEKKNIYLFMIFFSSVFLNLKPIFIGKISPKKKTRDKNLSKINIIFIILYEKLSVYIYMYCYILTWNRPGTRE